MCSPDIFLTLGLREYVPLKQGLRLCAVKALAIFIELREYVPLKQGLRQHLQPQEQHPQVSESMFH